MTVLLTSLLCIRKYACHNINQYLKKSSNHEVALKIAGRFINNLSLHVLGRQSAACNSAKTSHRPMNDISSGVARGGKRGNCPPFFQGERVGGIAICHVVTLGDEQIRRGTGYGD